MNRPCVLLCWVLGWAVAMGAQGESPDADLFVLKDTLAETMLASRERCAAAEVAAEARLGLWVATRPLPAESFAQNHVEPANPDFDALDGEGKRLWTERPEWMDGQVHMLPSGGRSSSYLYRVITAPAAMRLATSLGSDDGIEVWLNGAKVLSHDVPRGPAPDQESVDLALASGENRLLLKIHNNSGGHGFYFATASRAASLWRRIAEAHPVEASRLASVARGEQTAWFSESGDVEMEVRWIENALASAGGGASPLHELLEHLEAGACAPNDPRWIQLCLSADEAAETFRAVREEMEALDPAALRRAAEDLATSLPEDHSSSALIERLGSLQKRLPDIQKGLGEGDGASAEAARDLLALRRQLLLGQPCLDFDRLLFVRRKADLLGLPQNWQGNCSLPRRGYDNEIKVMRLDDPQGSVETLFRPKNAEFVGDVDLHFDGDRMLFSMLGSHDRWQIWEMGADGKGLRQVTPGEHPDVDNYDACYLPDGRIVFASSRCFHGVPCVAGSDAVANLCLMDADGENIRQLCFDQDHNWCPTVLNSGQVLFTRWEYSDTPHYFSRLLFRMNPDGTGQSEFYGSNSYWPNSLFYARPIPGHPTQVVAIVSGHHGVPRMGELILLDPARGRYEADGVVQRIPGYGKKVEPVIADQLVQESWPKFLHPYPLSDKVFLVSAQPTAGANWGLYLVDIFDNMLLLREEPGFALFEPIPLRSTPTPPVVADKARLQRDDATIYMADVYRGQGMVGVPPGTVKRLRVFEFHYAYPKMGGHVNVAVEGAWDVRRILGTVPVYADGSALFTIPANTPIAVQPLDADGAAVQVMRSWFTAMPGETLSCIGCHERQNAVPPSAVTLASKRSPVALTAWRGPARGFSFKRDVQPTLDERCVGCHNGDQSGRPDFSRKKKNGHGNFTPSYLALHPYVRRPGPESDYHIPAPMEFHAGTSELIQMLRKGHHGVTPDAEDWDRLVTWIDLNVPDHGTWGEHMAIPSNFHERRLEMRRRYAGRPEDPEAIPDLPVTDTAFVQPEAEPTEPHAEADWAFSAEEAKARQEAVGLAARRTLDLGDGVSMALALAPAGTFLMGDAAGYADERPATTVEIDKAFWMGVTEVTNAQFLQFDPSHDSGFFDQHSKDHTRPGYVVAQAADRPVVRVSWQQAVAFCEWLSERTGLRCALPTEAQWEWACRAGSDAPLAYGDLGADFSAFANLADRSLSRLAVAGIDPQPIANPSPFDDFVPKDARFDDGMMLTNDVGRYKPNAWGLRDMHGNVAEWTRSDFRPYPYDTADGRNAMVSDGMKTTRGGSWRDRPHRARSAFRLPYAAWQKVFNVGFRVIVEAETP